MNNPSDRQFLDIEIRIFPSDSRAEGYPVEITLNGGQEFPRGYLVADIVPWIPSGDLVADGQRLFDALISDLVLRRAWDEARGQASQAVANLAGRRIRLRIDADAPELHTLPWELLYEADTMLSANAATPFHRYLAVSTPWGDAVEERPLRVLAVISNPADLDDYGLAALDVEVERSILEKAFLTLDADLIQLDFLDAPVTLERLEEALQSGYHILHYLGHGVFDKRKEQAALYLQDDDGDTEPVPDAAFTQMLKRQSRPPRLVFLAACQSATRSTTDAFLGLGPKLVATGVPAVVAMQDLIAVKTARKLGMTFYRRLAEHGIVDCAMNEARSTLLTAGHPDAAVPVLFMRLASGRLWGTETKDEKASREVAGLVIPPPPEPNRPPEIPDFVGRQAELAYFAEKLDKLHMAVIAGMPGVGKTALAASLVREVKEPRKTFWHTFAKDEGIAAIIWKLAAFLAWNDQDALWTMLQSAQLTGGQLPPSAVLFDYLFQLLRGQGYLVCLDDFHFVDDDPVLDQFVARLRPMLQAGDLALIVASQRMPAFVNVSDFESLAGLSLLDTRQFVIQYGLEGRPGHGMRDMAVDLHAGTGGNARFLTQAVDTLKRTPAPERFLTRLFEIQDIERFLAKEIDEHLADDEREVMSAVAVLLGYAGTRDAIEAVLDGENARRTLRDLSQRHLLAIGQGEWGREYSLNAVLQQFYYDALSRRQRQTMHLRAGEYYESQEPDALRAAHHLEQAGEYPRAARLATANVWALINQGQARPLRQLLEQFRVAQLEAELWAQVNLAQGEVYGFLAERELAEQSYTQALAILESLPASDAVRELHARVCRGMGDLFGRESLPEAKQWLERGLAYINGLETEEEPTLRLKLSTLDIFAGEHEKALNVIQSVLASLPPGPSWLRLGALMNLGEIHRRKGDLPCAVAAAREGIEMAQTLHAYYQLMGLWVNLGFYQDVMGNWAEAVASYQQALTLAEQFSSVRHQTALSVNLSFVCTRQGDYERALQHAADGLTLAHAHNLPSFAIDSQMNLAEIYLRQGDAAAARAALTEAERLVGQTEENEELPEMLYKWARLALLEGNPALAVETARKAVDLAHELEMPLEEGMSQRVLAQALLAEGQTAAALETFATSLTLLEDTDPYEAASTQYWWGLALWATSVSDQGANLLCQARETFVQLGAQRDLELVEEVLENRN